MFHLSLMAKILAKQIKKEVKPGEYKLPSLSMGLKRNNQLQYEDSD